ncbi:hypothetical protein SCHPADRAFT_947450 [Schizopora paradoxa]|uniref:Chromatin elongation factor SPT5 n=1 Tax=Schizopora paradoxa TaxID=27342 RepID=A0A0H2RIW1_9AGAM|nr:hypothetical protein SCHPADRAFT_947450 [Schizopora paradoxa]
MSSIPSPSSCTPTLSNPSSSMYQNRRPPHPSAVVVHTEPSPSISRCWRLSTSSAVVLHPSAVAVFVHHSRRPASQRLRPINSTVDRPSAIQPTQPSSCKPAPSSSSITTPPSSCIPAPSDSLCRRRVCPSAVAETASPPTLYVIMQRHPPSYSADVVHVSAMTQRRRRASHRDVVNPSAVVVHLRAVLVVQLTAPPGVVLHHNAIVHYLPPPSYFIYWCCQCPYTSAVGVHLPKLTPSQSLSNFRRSRRPIYSTFVEQLQSSSSLALKADGFVSIEEHVAFADPIIRKHLIFGEIYESPALIPPRYNMHASEGGSSLTQKKVAARFIDDAALLDDRFEAEEEEEEIMEDDYEESEEEKDMDEGQRVHGKKMEKVTDEDEEQIDALVQRAQERARDHERVMASYGDVNQEDAPLQPHLQDHLIYAVKAKRGYEGRVVMYVLYCATTKTYQRVRSVFCVKKSPGYVYFETRDVGAIQDACRDVPNVYPMKHRLLTREEQVQLLQRGPVVPLKVGDWVRMTHGPFKGDVGRVFTLEENEGRIILTPRVRRPRTDLEEPRAKRARTDLGRRTRPVAQRLTLEKAYDWFGREKITIVDEGFKVEGIEYVFDKEGMIEPTLDRRYFIHCRPKLEEIQHYVDWTLEQLYEIIQEREAGSTIDDNKLYTFFNMNVDNLDVSRYFRVGDKVITYKGENKGTIGKITGIIGPRDDVVKIQMPNGVVLEESMYSIAPYLEVANYAEVRSGVCAGRRGTVTKLQGPYVTLYDEDNEIEIMVPAVFLQSIDRRLMAPEKSSVGMASQVRKGKRPLPGEVDILATQLRGKEVILPSLHFTLFHASFVPFLAYCGSFPLSTQVALLGSCSTATGTLRASCPWL